MYMYPFRTPVKEDLEAEEMARNLVVNDTPYVPPAKPVAEKKVYPREAAAIIGQLERDNEALFELLRHCIGVEALCKYCQRRDICSEMREEPRSTRNVFWSCINGCNFNIDPNSFGNH